jgi:DNA-directed RNA polymerase subunit RPC12/RpoP
MKEIMQNQLTTYPKGTEILCHACSTPLFALTKEADHQADVTKEMLQPIAPQKKPRDVNKAKCGHCGSRVLYSKLRVPNGTTYTYRMGKLVEVKEPIQA